MTGTEKDYWVQLIETWHDRIEKATMNVSTHLFREVLDVVKEMEVHINEWKHDRNHTLPSKEKP